MWLLLTTRIDSVCRLEHFQVDSHFLRFHFEFSTPPRVVIFLDRGPYKWKLARNF